MQGSQEGAALRQGLHQGATEARVKLQRSPWSRRGRAQHGLGPARQEGACQGLAHGAGCQHQHAVPQARMPRPCSHSMNMTSACQGLAHRAGCQHQHAVPQARMHNHLHSSRHMMALAIAEPAPARGWPVGKAASTSMPSYAL